MTLPEDAFDGSDKDDDDDDNGSDGGSDDRDERGEGEGKQGEHGVLAGKGAAGSRAVPRIALEASRWTSVAESSSSSSPGVKPSPGNLQLRAAAFAYRCRRLVPGNELLAGGDGAEAPAPRILYGTGTVAASDEAVRAQAQAAREAGARQRRLRETATRGNATPQTPSVAGDADNDGAAVVSGAVKTPDAAGAAVATAGSGGGGSAAVAAAGEEGGTSLSGAALAAMRDLFSSLDEDGDGLLAGSEHEAAARLLPDVLPPSPGGDEGDDERASSALTLQGFLSFVVAAVVSDELSQELEAALAAHDAESDADDDADDDADSTTATGGGAAAGAAAGADASGEVATAAVAASDSKANSSTGDAAPSGPVAQLWAALTMRGYDWSLAHHVHATAGDAVASQCEARKRWTRDVDGALVAAIDNAQESMSASSAMLTLNPSQVATGTTTSTDYVSHPRSLTLACCCSCMYLPGGHRQSVDGGWLAHSRCAPANGSVAASECSHHEGCATDRPVSCR